MKNKGKLAALIVWCVLVVCCFAAARSFLSTVLLLGTAVVLLFCIASVKKCGHTLQTELKLPQEITQGKKKSGRLYIRNTGGFPMFCVKGTVCCKGESGEAVSQPFTCAVKPYQLEEITFRLSSALPENVHVWVNDLTVYDMLGLFSYSADVAALTADVTVTEALTAENAEETTDALTAENAEETTEALTAENAEAGRENADE